MSLVLLVRICIYPDSRGGQTNRRRQQVIRLERELAAAKAAADFTKLSANGDGKDDELQERFVKYESELSAANQKIAECTTMIRIFLTGSNSDNISNRQFYTIERSSVAIGSFIGSVNEDGRRQTQAS